MKKSVSRGCKYLVSLFLFSLLQAVVWAQDSSVSTHSTTVTSSSNQSSDWYTSPWVWVIGAAVFILLLVALLRSNSSSSGRSDKVTVTKTVRRDTDTDGV